MAVSCNTGFDHFSQWDHGPWAQSEYLDGIIEAVTEPGCVGRPPVIAHCHGPHLERRLVERMLETAIVHSLNLPPHYIILLISHVCFCFSSTSSSLQLPLRLLSSCHFDFFSVTIPIFIHLPPISLQLPHYQIPRHQDVPALPRTPSVRLSA